MLKKSLALFVILSLTAITLVACGGSEDAASTATASTASEVTGEQTADTTGSGDETLTPVVVDQIFDITNSTGIDIYHMYISPSASNSWGSDVLGDEIFANGETRTVTFPLEETGQYWDVRVEDEEGTALTFIALDLSTVSAIDLTIEQGNPIAYTF